MRMVNLYQPVRVKHIKEVIGSIIHLQIPDMAIMEQAAALVQTGSRTQFLSIRWIKTIKRQLPAIKEMFRH